MCHTNATAPEYTNPQRRVNILSDYWSERQPSTRVSPGSYNPF